MNAKEEFLIHTGLVTSNVNKIKCAEIQFGHDSYYLGTGWDKQEAKDFLDKIDFDYDNGYGTQNLYGVVWYEDRWLDWEYEWYDDHEYYLNQESEKIGYTISHEFKKEFYQKALERINGITQQEKELKKQGVTTIFDFIGESK